MKKILASIFVVIYMVVGSGCATLADAKAAKGSGTVAIYDQEYDLVWKTTIETIKSLDLDLVSDSKESGTILAQRGMTAFSYGENVAVFVERIGDKIKTRVEVVNKRALATNITAANWELRIIRELNSRLNKS